MVSRETLLKHTGLVRLELSEATGEEMADSKLHWSHTAVFEASPTCASQARAFVSHHLVDHRLLYLVDPVRLVASELATNALVHAQTAFNVTLSASDARVLLRVQNHSLALPERRTAQAVDATSLGLEIVGIISLEWGINGDETGLNEVWASFAIRAPRQF